MRNAITLSALLSFVHGTAAFADVQEIAESFESLRAQRMAREAPTIPADSYARAESGELVSGLEAVEGVAAAKGWGVAVYDTPIAFVWKAVNDEDEFADRLPVSHSEVVSGQANRDDRYLFQYMPLPMVDDRWWVTHMRHNSELFDASDGRMWELAWTDATSETHLSAENQTLIEEAQAVDWTHGAWLLFDLGDGRTLVEYYVWSDPGGMLPPGPASRFAGGAVRDTLSAMRDLSAEHEAGTVDGRGFVRPDQTTLP